MKTRTGLNYPRKGSPEAKAWGRRMAALRKHRDKRKKAPVGNPGSKWHWKEHYEAGDDAKTAPSSRVRHFQRGKSVAHLESALAAEAGVNPQTRKRKVRKNPITIYNPPVSEILYVTPIEIRGKRASGKYKGKHFRHTFASSSRVEVCALNDGNILIRSRNGKRLWGYQ